MAIQAPSKTFIKNASIVALIVAAFFGFQVYWKKYQLQRQEKALAGETVSTVVGKDSNENGIPDWEERLWGLDPTVSLTDGVSNKTIIESKKKQLGVNEKPGEALTETERASRELFAITVALSQNENLDSSVLEEVTKKMGESADIELTDALTISTVKTIPTTRKNLETYAAKLNTATAKYASNTAEIKVLLDSVESSDAASLGRLIPIINNYRGLASELITMQVPIGVASEHVGITNSLDKVALSLSLIADVEKDALKAAAGASLYRAATVSLDLYTNSLRNFFTRYSIIQP